MKDYELLIIENHLNDLDNIIKRRYWKNNNILVDFNDKIESLISFYYKNKEVFKNV